MVNLRSKENKYKGHQQGQRGKEPLTKFLEFYKLEGPLTRVLGYYEVEKGLWGLGNYTMSYAGRLNCQPEIEKLNCLPELEKWNCQQKFQKLD
jgi:hypothetical protein